LPTTSETTDEDLHSEIDELALKIEREIQAQKETLENAPDADPKYRRMQEAKVENIELF
jgi:ribosome-associated translation inhibitor RaiA